MALSMSQFHRFRQAIFGDQAHEEVLFRFSLTATSEHEKRKIGEKQISTTVRLESLFSAQTFPWLEGKGHSPHLSVVVHGATPWIRHADDPDLEIWEFGHK